MGTIEERKSDIGGETNYRAKVRLKGTPVQSATFQRKTDAKKWIQKTETEIREGRYFQKSQGKKNTVSDVIERYLSILEKNNPKRAKDVTRLLDWWREEIGYYCLSDLNKDIFIKARENLQNRTRERKKAEGAVKTLSSCLLYTSPSPRDRG